MPCGNARHTRPTGPEDSGGAQADNSPRHRPIGVGCRVRSVAPKRLGAKLRSGCLPFLSGFGRRALPSSCGEAICQERQLPQAVSRFGKVRNPRKAGSLERDQPLSPLTIPWSPARKWKRREHFRPEGHEGLGPGSRSQGGEGESLGGANAQEGKVRPSPPSGGGESGPFPVGVNLWSRGRPACGQGGGTTGEARP